jgi:hypothetical protein
MQELYQNGYNAAVEFLNTWNWAEYLDHFRRPGT